MDEGHFEHTVEAFGGFSNRVKTRRLSFSQPINRSMSLIGVDNDRAVVGYPAGDRGRTAVDHTALVRKVVENVRTDLMPLQT